MIALRRPAPQDEVDDAPSGADGGRRVAPDTIGLVVGVAIVLVHAALTLRRSLWLDEAYTLGAVTDLGFSLRETHGTMGAYYVVVWAFGQVSTAAWWLRVPSVLFAVATLVATRAVARRVGGRELAAVAVPLLALLPVFAWKATEARSYSLVTLLIATAWYLGLRAVEADEARDERRWWLLVVPVAIVGSLAHGLFPVHLAPLALLALLGPRPWPSLRRLAPALVAAAATALALRSAGARNVGTHTVGGPSEWVRSSLHELLPGGTLVWLLLFAAVSAGLGLSVVAARRAASPVARARAAVPALYAVGPCAGLVAMSLVDPKFNARYLSPVMPGIALCLGLTAVALAARLDLRSRDLRLVVVATVLGGLLVASSLTAVQPDLQDWNTAAEVVAAEAEPGDAIVFPTLVDGERPPFEAAWRDVDASATPVVLTSARPLGEVRRYEDDVRTVPEVGRAAADQDRIWVVSGGFYGKAGAEVTLADPGFADHEVTGRWPVDGGIEVRLYERT